VIHPGGAVVADPASPASPSPGYKHPQKRRNPKGKKARKAAARKAQAAGGKVANTAALVAAGRGRKARGAHRVPDHASPSQETPAMFVAAPDRQPAPDRQAAPEALPLAAADPQLALCLQAQPAPALTLPSRPEPLVEATSGGDVAEPSVRPAPSYPFTVPGAFASPPVPASALTPVPARVLRLASMPGIVEQSGAPEPEGPAERDVLAANVPALSLPAAPEPLIVAEQPPAAALAALAEGQSLPETMPLQRSRALVPARRQGLIDTIAFLLRDSGRRLARWSAKRERSRAERALLIQAEARQRALLSQLAALEAIRRREG
jgi:hypothetical protein